MKRSPIRRRSKKRAKLYREERVPLVIELLAQIDHCERCLQRPPVDVHELKSRARGGSILDESNLVALCRQCHDWITTHPKQATDQGWLRNSWDN